MIKNVDYLRRNYTPEQISEFLSKLSPEELEELKYDWMFWARETQLAPKGNWNTCLFLAGRGAGKTRSGSEWVRLQIKAGAKRLAAVAPTKGDVRRVMVEGDSGLLSVCWKGDKTDKGDALGFPDWSPTNNTITWANGAKVEFFSAEDPERLRGPQFEGAWCDEVCSWNHSEMVWDMLQFCLRLGKHPRSFLTTTPKPTKLLRRIVADPKTVRLTGSTYDNAANLADTYLDAVKTTYEGTRLGRQELYAEILDEAAGALWNRELLEQCEIDDSELPEYFNRIVVAVDPATTTKVDSDQTGIIVAGIDVNGCCYVLDDSTDYHTPQETAKKVCDLYHEFEADAVVAEGNQGRDYVKHTIQQEDPSINVRMVHAQRGKHARAEPVSALYERGLVKHVKGLDKLEDQMVQWEPLGTMGSPDRIDALTWAITELALKGRVVPKLHIYSQSAEKVGVSG